MLNDNRQNIIKATNRLLQTHGLVRLTTSKIAQEAKVAEGLIYHHFKDKAELIFEVVQNRVQEAKNLMQNLPLEVGKRTLLENLENILFAVYHAYHEITPIIYSIFADQHLHIRMQEIIEKREKGPQYAIKGLAVYLAAEQRLGRLSVAVDTPVLAKCLWMLSTQLAMLENLMGNKPDEKHVRNEIRSYLKNIVIGIEPQSEQKKKTKFKKKK
ncbi:MAG: TetR/AcrR family transcriptional regulator [Syntrophaceae bacterium]|nr:TetR/AcrR family transcriptional regulator [Syntrophaceae bacterium]